MLTIFRLLLLSIESSLWRTLSEKIEEEDKPTEDDDVPVVVDDEDSDVDEEELSFDLLLLILLLFALLTRVIVVFEESFRIIDGFRVPAHLLLILFVVDNDLIEVKSWCELV